MEELLKQVKQEQANYVPKSKQKAVVTPAKPIWGHWQDWITFAVLLIIVLDHLRQKVRWLRLDYWFGKTKKARDSGVFEESLIDENSMKKSNLRQRKNKKGKKNQLKSRNNNDDEKALKQAQAEMKTKTAPAGINFYDVAKIIAVVTMIIDHYGYFGLPGISYTVSRWTRVVGRLSAPLFFFLTGYSGSFRFRWHTWCYAVFLFTCNAWLGLRLTATSFESLVIVLSLNWLFSYIKLEKLNHWFFHLLLFIPLCLVKDIFSSDLRIAYGSLPYILAIAGYLAKRKHFMSKAWAAGSMIHFAYVAVGVFSNSPLQTKWICGLCALEGLVFLFVNQLASVGEYKFSARLPAPIRNGFLYISRNALVVYVVHLQLFRLVQMKTWNW